MKLNTLLVPLITLSLTWSQPAQWTSSDGRDAIMTLMSVSEDADKLSGKFKTSNGAVVTLSEDKLAESEKARLQEKLEQQKVEQEKSPEKTTPSADDIIYPAIEKDLLVFDGRRLKRMGEFTPPSKYYLFYKTASWCPPCQKFTPDLVKFYKKYKKSHGSAFEIILLTSDKSEDDQENPRMIKKWNGLS